MLGHLGLESVIISEWLELIRDSVGFIDCTCISISGYGLLKHAVSVCVCMCLCVSVCVLLTRYRTCWIQERVGKGLKQERRKGIVKGLLSEMRGSRLR